jgi:hypothetical protein
MGQKMNISVLVSASLVVLLIGLQSQADRVIADPFPDLPKYPGNYPSLRAPWFIPQCKYEDGVYVCSDFARDLCKQYYEQTPQIPGSACNFLAYCGTVPSTPKVGPPHYKRVCHAINVLSQCFYDGEYAGLCLNCAVDPQLPFPHEGVDGYGACYWTPDRPGPYPIFPDDRKDFERKLCEHLGKGCIMPSILPDYWSPFGPDQQCHPQTGGCRKGVVPISSEM